MDPITALQALAAIYNFVTSQQQEAARKQQMKNLLSNVDNLTNLVQNLRDVIKRALADQVLHDQHAKLHEAQLLFESGQLTEAAQNSRDAAARLMEDDVKVDGALSFLAAAGLHIITLTELAAMDQLHTFAKAYSSHASDLWIPVELTVGARIAIGTTQDNGIRVFYTIDGQDQPAEDLLVTAAVAQRARNFQEGKKVRDYKKMAAPITYALRIAAENWRAVGYGEQPSYAGILDGIIITSVNPDQPWSYVAAGGRLNFAVSKSILHLSKTVCTVHPDVYGSTSIEYMGDIIEAAKCIHIPGAHPAGFIISANGTRQNALALVDSSVIIEDNNSTNVVVDGAEYNQHLPPHAPAPVNLHRDNFEVFVP